MVVSWRRRQARYGKLRLLADFKLSATRVVVASPTVHATIPPVLHCIVATPSEAPCNLGPPLAHLANHLLDNETFLWRDGLVVEIGLQVLVKALAALLWRPCLYRRRNPHPVMCAVYIHQVDQMRIFGL